LSYLTAVKEDKNLSKFRYFGMTITDQYQEQFKLLECSCYPFHDLPSRLLLLEFKIYKTKFYLFCMGVKLGLLFQGKNTD
jgi:hypothetical protein